MKVLVSNNYESMSQSAAKDLLDLIQYKKNPVICVASGDTQKEMYKELIKQVKENDIDVSNWYFIGLDEWIGMNGNDEGSCRYHLNRQLFHPLKIAQDKIAFFDGRAKNIQSQCEGIEDYIDLLGGIDVAILGLGMNGHVGMNEPGTPADSRSHIAEIATITQQVGQKYFTTQKELTHGLTLGIATLHDAGNIMLLANGIKKAQIVLEFLGTENSVHFPASLLTDHPNLLIYLDKDAASLTELIKK